MNDILLSSDFIHSFDPVVVMSAFLVF